MYDNDFKINILNFLYLQNDYTYLLMDKNNHPITSNEIIYYIQHNNLMGIEWCISYYESFDIKSPLYVLLKTYIRQYKLSKI